MFNDRPSLKSSYGPAGHCPKKNLKSEIRNPKSEGIPKRLSGELLGRFFHCGESMVDGMAGRAGGASKVEAPPPLGSFGPASKVEDKVLLERVATVKFNIFDMWVN